MEAQELKDLFYSQFTENDLDSSKGDSHLLVQELGLDTFLKLLKKVPGDPLYIPKITKYKSVWKKILTDPKISNIPTKELANSMNVSETYINQVKCDIRLEKQLQSR